MQAEAVEQYKRALKAGEKYYDEAVRSERDPYLEVLEEKLPNLTSMSVQYLGLIDIPTDLIVGTKTAGRRDAFAGNFMPLLDRETEFGIKWVALCSSHFDEGIHDPITCFEYFGKFYVQEGNKRVSVLKSLGARKIPGIVTRVLPEQDGSPLVELYNEFLQFYRLSGLYTVQYHLPGSYAKLQASLGFEPDHVWTEEERMAFNSRYFIFTSVFREHLSQVEYKNVSAAGALLCWLQVYPYESLKTMTARELDHSLTTVWPEIMRRANNYDAYLSTEPQTQEKGFLSRLFGSVTQVKVAFVHAATSSGSNWIAGHEAGAEQLERNLGSRVRVEQYYADTEDAESVMEKAIANGTELLIVTAPTLLSATRKVATLHPRVVVMVCALSMPLAGVQTYYVRSYEAKFIAGALAGAMSDEDTIGFIAKSPIFGVPAEINAFALGARMTNPDVRIALRWTGAESNPSQALLDSGVRVISGHDVSSVEELKAHNGFGTFQIDEKGNVLPLSTPCWNWGNFYERGVRNILDGDWDYAEGVSAINYWWGMDSGVIDIMLADRLPAGVVQLAKILKKNIISGGIDIFKTKLVDQNGTIRNDGTRSLTPGDIMKMDWLLDNVDGKIPAFDELLPMAQNLTRILGVYRDEIPPEKEGFLL